MLLRLLLSLALPAASLASVGLSTTTTLPSTRYPTQSLFQSYQDGFTRNGPLLPLPLTRASGECALGPFPPPPPAIANASISGSSVPISTILIVDWGMASDCGIDTLGQLGRLAEQSTAALVSTTYPSPATLLILLDRHYAGVPINPLHEPYTAHSSQTPETPPADLSIQVVGSGDADLIRASLNSLGFPLGPSPPSWNSTYPMVLAGVTAENGPWNDLFMGGGFRTVRWFLFTVNILLGLWAIVQLVLALRSRSFHLDVRNVIFLAGTVGTLFLLSYTPLGYLTYARQILEAIHYFIIQSAFLLLLLLWSHILRRLLLHPGGHREVMIIRGLIVLGSLATLWHLVLALVQANIYPSGGGFEGARAASNVVLPLVQSIVALQFLYSTWGINRRLRDMRTPQPITDTLHRITLIGSLSFIVNLIAAIVTPQVLSAGLTTPSAMALVFIGQSATLTLQNILLLGVLGIKTSEHMAECFHSPDLKGDKGLRKKYGGWGRQGGVGDSMISSHPASHPTSPKSPPTPRSPPVEAQEARGGILSPELMSKLRSAARGIKPMFGRGKERTSPPPPPVSTPTQGSMPHWQLRRPTAILANIDAEDRAMGGGSASRTPVMPIPEFSDSWRLAIQDAAAMDAERKASFCSSIGDEPRSRRPSSWCSDDREWDDEVGDLPPFPNSTRPRNDSQATDVTDGTLRWSKISALKDGLCDVDSPPFSGTSRSSTLHHSTSPHIPDVMTTPASPAPSGPPSDDWGSRRRSSLMMRYA